MIKLFRGADIHREPQVADQMFRGRKVIFRDRLGWDVPITNGWEIDRYDEMDPLYLVSVDDVTNVVRGSLRLMPTVGPTLLSEVFAGDFDEPVDLRSPLIWEGTRFCVHPDSAPVTPTGVNLATAELFIAMCEVGLDMGLEQIIGVYDPRMIRIYRRIGWSPEKLAESNRREHGPIYVGLWDIDTVALETMAERSGLVGSVIAAGHDAMVRSAA